MPVDSFYEWKKTATGKQPYAITLADRPLMALAGLWEKWRSPMGEWVRSFAIITFTTACRWSLNPKPGRFGLKSNLRMPQRSRPCWRRFHPRK